MGKLIYCAVVMRIGNIVEPGVGVIPVDHLYAYQDYCSTNQLSIHVNTQMPSDAEPKHITHIAYGRTEEDAMRRLDQLGWQDYCHGVVHFYGGHNGTALHRVGVHSSTTRRSGR